MPISKLPDLVEGHQDFTVHVYVSRLWQHRGASDDGPIKHTDIVFQDVEVLSFIVFIFCSPFREAYHSHVVDRLTSSINFV